MMWLINFGRKYLKDLRPEFVRMSGTDTISFCREQFTEQSPRPQQFVLNTKLLEKSDKIVLFITL